MKKIPVWRYLGYSGVAVICLVLLLMVFTSEKSEEVETLLVSDIPIVEAVNHQMNEHGLQLGDEVIMRHDAPYFPEELSLETSLDALHVEYYGMQGETFQVLKTGIEMISVETSERGILWIPVWYTMEESTHIENVEPRNVTLSSQAKLFLSPNSGVKWKVDATDQRYWVTVAKWKDWYGVIMQAKTWHEDYNIYRPIILWVHESEIDKQEVIQGGLLDIDSNVPLDVARSMIEMMLRKGMGQSVVRTLLGEPHHVERSENLQMILGDPLTLGVKWRYEFTNAQYTVTFTKEGKLDRSEWIFPTLDMTRVNVNPGNDYHFNYRFLNTPIASTMELNPQWTNQGDLDFTYLIGANDDVLLLKGDDGGFSGMHMASSIYGLNRHTGEKLWQIDAGFGGINAEMNREGTHVTIFSEYNPEEKIYETRVRHIRLADGVVIWEVKPSNGPNGIVMTAAYDSIVLYDRRNLEEMDGTLTVLDSKSGKMKWKKKLTGDYQVRNEGSQDPYVLIQIEQELRGMDVKTGKVNWVQKDIGEGHINQKTDPYYPNINPYYAGGPRVDPFVKQSTKRLIMLGGQWVFMDLNTGKYSAQYPANPNEVFEILDERYLLVQRPMELNLGGDETSYETAFHDLTENRTLWTLKGRASKGLLEDSRLYLAVDGIPTAVDKDSGAIIWQMGSTYGEEGRSFMNVSHFASSSYGIVGDYLLLPYGDDLLLLQKQDGKLLGRVQDKLMGYAELRDLETRNGTLNISGDEIYVGSANGGFTRFSVAMIKEWLSER